jgi:hypothetical protein
MAMSPDEFYLNSFSFGYKLRKKIKVKKVKKEKKIKVKRLSKKYNISVPKTRKILKSIKTKNTKKKLKLFKKKINAFGKKKRWIQKVTKTFAKKGTKGAFTRWCKRKGYKGVTAGCIKRGKKDRSLRTRRRAIFAENVRR